MKIDYYNVKFNERGVLTEPNGYIDGVKLFSMLKNSLPKLILEEPTLSNLEKLKLITRERLWGVAPCVQKEFEEWEAECVELEKAESNKNGMESYSTAVMNHIHSYKEYSTVYYIDIIHDLIEWSEGKDCITILSSYGKYNSIISKPVNEVIDRICKYAFENEIIGFVVDY